MSNRSPECILSLHGSESLRLSQQHALLHVLHPLLPLNLQRRPHGQRAIAWRPGVEQPAQRLMAEGRHRAGNSRPRLDVEEVESVQNACSHPIRNDQWSCVCESCQLWKIEINSWSSPCHCSIGKDLSCTWAFHFLVRRGSVRETDYSFIPFEHMNIMHSMLHFFFFIF